MGDGEDDWDEWELEGEREPEPRPRDRVVDEAREALEEFFAQRSSEVFYGRQVEVMFENRYFHWIAERALSELSEEGVIASSMEELPRVGSIRFYRNRGHRYWRRQASEIKRLVQEFSAPDFTRGLGEQGEMLFDAALPTAGFVPTSRDVKGYGSKEWTETQHDLDRVFERDGVAYGAEVKNSLSYMPRDELEVKLKMCKFLGLRPLFIVRAAPKS